MLIPDLQANVEDVISIDTKYLFSLLQPNASWGAQKPHEYVYHTFVNDFAEFLMRHSPQTGIFFLADTIKRKIPTSFKPVTHESIHPSVLEQGAVLPQLKNTLATYPALISQLTPLEQQAKQQWPHISGQYMNGDTINVAESLAPGGTTVVRRGTIISWAVKSLRRPRRDDTRRSIGTLSQRQDPTRRMTVDEKGWLVRLVQETSLGVFIRDLV